MAKPKSTFSISGTVNGITYVNSKAYGQHIRAARGTHTPVEVNETFKIVSKQLVSANLPAKMIKDALDPYRKSFVSGMMWQRLVSLFRLQYRDKGKFDFRALQDFDVHTEYPLDRLVTFQTQVSTDFLQSQVMVNLYYNDHPDFKKIREVDGYRITCIAIYPDLKRKTATTYEVALPILKLRDEVKPLTIGIPQHTDLTLLCIKVEACVLGSVLNDASTKGMKILRVVEAG